MSNDKKSTSFKFEDTVLGGAGVPRVERRDPRWDVDAPGMDEYNAKMLAQARRAVEAVQLAGSQKFDPSTMAEWDESEEDDDE
jgi:hypothetical protein